MTQAWALFWIGIKSRGISVSLSITSIALAVMTLLGGSFFLLQVDSSYPPRAITAWEALPVIGGAAVASAHSGGLWAIERFGVRISPKISRALCVIAITYVFSIFPAVAQLYLPPEARWFDLIWNIAIFISLSHLVCALVGQRLGVVLSTLSYLGLAALQQAYPLIGRYLPLSGSSGNYQPHVMEAVLFSIVVAVFCGITCGATKSHIRRQHNEV